MNRPQLPYAHTSHSVKKQIFYKVEWDSSDRCLENNWYLNIKALLDGDSQIANPHLKEELFQQFSEKSFFYPIAILRKNWRFRNHGLKRSFVKLAIRVDSSIRIHTR